MIMVVIHAYYRGNTMEVVVYSKVKGEMMMVVVVPDQLLTTRNK